ncbi:MAG: glycosyltransferase family 2 protein [Candidatus Acidiferrales bacterium]
MAAMPDVGYASSGIRITVIISACNEQAVITETLKTMTDGAKRGELDVVVVCNGCTDDTAAIARRFGNPVRVIETEIGGKSGALNLGDEAAHTFPRIYVDADVRITIAGIRSIAYRLLRGDVLAVGPIPTVDLTGCSWPVRAFFNIRSRLPSAREGIGGSGVYALSQAGHRRIGAFPNVVADDGYVRICFRNEERESVASINSTIFAPRTIRDLIATKSRAHYGSFQLERLFPELWENRGESNQTSLMGLFKYPRLWMKLLIYCSVTAIAKNRARNRFRSGTFSWQRDDSSRVPNESIGFTARARQ